MHKARTGIPIRITAIFKKSVDPRFIKSTSLIYCLIYDFNTLFIVLSINFYCFLLYYLLLLLYIYNFKGSIVKRDATL